MDTAKHSNDKSERSKSAQPKDAHDKPLAPDQPQHSSEDMPDASEKESCGVQSLEAQLLLIVSSCIASGSSIAEVSTGADFFEDLQLEPQSLNKLCQKLRAHDAKFSTLSIRDLYRHASVEKLASYLQTAHSSEQPAEGKTPHQKTSKLSFVMCGCAQALYLLLAAVLLASALSQAIPWLYSSRSFSEVFLRCSSLTLAWLVAGTALPVALKWLLLGRTKSEAFPLWSFKYFRFWAVKCTLNLSPLAWYAGTPLYNTYLRLLGAKVASSAVLHLEEPPVCADLLSIGEHSVVHQGASIDCHKAHSGLMFTAAVSIGREADIGIGSRLDLGTVVCNKAKLKHSSTLMQGQQIPASQTWHGTPAEPTGNSTQAPPNQPTGFTRRLLFSVTLLLMSFVLPLGLLAALAVSTSLQLSTLASLATPYTGLWVRQCFALALAMGVALMLLSIVSSIWFPRLLRPALRPSITRRRYGAHHLIYLINKRLCNAMPLHRTLGDSIYIDDYLQAVGYTFVDHKRSGLHFGLEIKNDSPHLNTVAHGARAASQLRMVNLHETASAVRLEPNALPMNSALGHQCNLPTDHRLGEHCVVAAQTMIPNQGKLRSHCRLFGSPPIEHPMHTKPHQNNDRQTVMLPAKNRHNLVTVALHLSSLLVTLWLIVMSFALDNFQTTASTLHWLGYMSLALLSTALWQVAMERLYKPDHKEQLPHQYDPEYWQEERSQKLKSERLNRLFAGTAWRSVLLRVRGARVGKYLYDEGLSCTELSQLSIADHCTINRHTQLQTNSEISQTHSTPLIRLEQGVSLEPGARLNSGTHAKAHARVCSNAVLLADEVLAEHSVWQGNPAAPVA